MAVHMILRCIIYSEATAVQQSNQFIHRSIDLQMNELHRQVSENK